MSLPLDTQVQTLMHHIGAVQYVPPPLLVPASECHTGNSSKESTHVGGTMSLGLLDPILSNLGVEWWRPVYGTLGVVVILSPFCLLHLYSQPIWAQHLNTIKAISPKSTWIYFVWYPSSLKCVTLWVHNHLDTTRVNPPSILSWLLV
jgi:hypothetical protein